MAINIVILKKLKEKTTNEMEIREFLTAILHFESETNGWFENQYIKILEANCKED